MSRESARLIPVASTVRFSSSSSQSSLLEDLSSSIEKLVADSTNNKRDPRDPSNPVFTPRAAPSSAVSPEKQLLRGGTFMNGQYYNPSNLSYESITKPRPRLARPLLGPSRKEAEAQDLLHITQLNPGKPSLHDDSYKNGAILSYYVTDMGKIMPRNISGLTRKSQRNIGKAIRRARAMGLIPFMSRGGTRTSGSGWKD